MSLGRVMRGETRLLTRYLVKPQTDNRGSCSRAMTKRAKFHNLWCAVNVSSIFVRLLIYIGVKWKSGYVGSILHEIYVHMDGFYILKASPMN